jgi:hypothetical protein
MKKQKKYKKLPRTHKVSIMLNNEEKKLIDNYIFKHKLTTLAKCMREITLRHIFLQMEKDSPRLFD